MNALWLFLAIGAVTAMALWLGWRKRHRRLRDLDED
jgi:hypothetical protein